MNSLKAYIDKYPEEILLKWLQEGEKRAKKKKVLVKKSFSARKKLQELSENEIKELIHNAKKK